MTNSSPSSRGERSRFPGFVTDRLSIQPSHDPPGNAPEEAPGHAAWGTSGQEIRLEVHLREPRHRVGEIRLRVSEADANVVELELALVPDHQDDGLVGEAASPVFDYLFGEQRKTLARHWTRPGDEASARAVRLLGMSPETLEIRGAKLDGRWHDRMSYALTRQRWAAVRRSRRESVGPVEPRASDLWAVTSFFNPAGYRRHREKYRVFRERLGVPLAAVELAYGPDFELGPGDAERLLRLRSRHVLWQKERLLNLAIEALPEEARFVVWVDSDVVFEREGWSDLTREALLHLPLVQPYGRVLDLPAGAEPNRRWAARASLTRRSLGALCANGGFDPGQTSMDMLDVGSPGHAWAMRREPLAEVGLYDALILGSGDNAMAMAALGHAETYVASYRMNPHEARHYRRWASRFFEAAGGKVGFVPGELYHLWHGDLSHRGYSERYPGLEPFGFNPEEDLALDDQGAWRWATHKTDLHRYVAKYFGSRREDG